MALTSLEANCLKVSRSGQAKAPTDCRPDDDTGWVQFVLGVTIDAARMVRGLRIESLRGSTRLKEDATPVTQHELDIESMFRRALSAFHPESTLVGEESGGRIPDRGIAVALDPIDGTWALLNRTSTFATCVTVYRDGSPFLGVVLNPATAELGYSLAGGTSRLLQFDVFGEDDRASDLPLERASSEVLVNLHPSRQVGPVADAVLAAWREQRVRLVRMEGGSPSAALLEAAKGSFVYVNLWGRRPAEPFDLAAGVLLVRGAGGTVIGTDGEPIDPVAHTGPFIAGVHDGPVQTVLQLIRLLV